MLLHWILTVAELGIRSSFTRMLLLHVDFGKPTISVIKEHFFKEEERNINFMLRNIKYNLSTVFVLFCFCLTQGKAFLLWRDSFSQVWRLNNLVVISRSAHKKGICIWTCVGKKKHIWTCFMGTNSDHGSSFRTSSSSLVFIPAGHWIETVSGPWWSCHSLPGHSSSHCCKTF